MEGFSGFSNSKIMGKMPVTIEPAKLAVDSGFYDIPGRASRFPLE